MLLIHLGGPSHIGKDVHDFSDRRSARLALDAAIVIAGLLLWALLLQAQWAGGPNPGAAKQCVSFGRAGVRCVESPERRESGAPAHEQRRTSFGRAGLRCEPETVFS